MTWYITTSQEGASYGVRRIAGRKAIELIGLEGADHEVMTTQEAQDAGFSPCRPATEAEAQACEDALERHKWRLAWERREAQQRPVEGWHEVRYQDQRWWGRQLASGAVELVSPAGTRRFETRDTLTPGRRVDDDLALAALRMTSVLAKVPVLVLSSRGSQHATKSKPALVIGEGKSALELAQERLNDAQEAWLSPPPRLALTTRGAHQDD